MRSPHQYDILCRLARHHRLPAMFVDLAAFDRNTKRFVDDARQGSKRLRIASKSLRVPKLLNRFRKLAGDVAQGVMCYSVAEAHWLASGDGEQSCPPFDDLLVAYPHFHPEAIRSAIEVMRQGKTITLMIDCADHVDLLVRGLGKFDEEPLRVCIDVDASLRKFGQHLGAQRSPLRSVERLRVLLQKIKQTPQLKAVGAMTYEAQVAGLADNTPRQSLRNTIIRRIKSSSTRWLLGYRREIRSVFEAENIQMEMFNGGGSGSFAQSLKSDALTELTVGSGLLQSHLFDHFSGNRSEPALFFALPITRLPQKGLVTCHSGGFIASGAPGADRQPLVFQPSGLQVDGREGFGEVQTPLRVPPALRGKLRIGDPIFFRPAKAGEIAERFAEYHLFRGDEIIDKADTYRGLGKCFY